MDDIYRGILLSEHSDVMKRALVAKVILSASETIDSVGQMNVIDAVLGLALETAILSPDPQHRLELGCVVFETWARRHIVRARVLFTVELLRHYLSEEVNADLTVVLRLVSFVFCPRDQFGNNESCQSNKSQSVIDVLIEEAPRLLDRDENLNVAAPLVELFLNVNAIDLPELKIKTFVRKLVRCMARCRPTDRPQLAVLVRNAKTVATFMKMLLTLGDREAVEHCLGEMFLVLSSPIVTAPNGINTTTEPCSCLAAILSVFPVAFLEAASRSAVLEVRFDNRVLETILRRLLDWLIWPGAKNLDVVIMHYMATLESLDRHLMLIRVTQQLVPKLFLYLRSTMWCEFVLPVLLKMLLSYGHSSDVFHSIVPTTPSVLQCLLNPTETDVDGRQQMPTDRHSDIASDVASQVIPLIYTLMELFPGFPEIYDPLVTELQNYPKPDKVKMEAMKDYAIKNKWTCQSRSLLIASSFALQTKSSTGKVGLFNLGQSCYANSILQALYMNDEFRNKILQEMSTRMPAPIFDLQNVFAFLTHSQRAAYSPEAFLRVSRPPWFLEGNQQDCSEYLRYFLDQLHEQGKLPICYNNVKDLSVSGATNNTTISTTVCEFHKLSTLNNDESGSNRAKKLCLIHDLFGGQLLISYQCFNCLQMSRQIETFIDLSLSLNYSQSSILEDVKDIKTLMEATCSESASSPSTSNNTSKKSLKLDDLLQFYLTPEKLEGENSYHCVNCGQLQEAQKTTTITKAPKYLILTLLRFSYDSKTHQRTKILQNVDYPEVLRLPTYNGGCLSTELYSLYAVVMHSGTSSDCGHYYTYACHSRTLPEFFCHDKEVVKNIEERSWYLFNDSRVTYSQYKSFCNGGTNNQKKQQQHFGRDTAYLLFYRKITAVDVDSCSASDGGSGLISEHDPKVLNLHGDLYEAVHKDNQSYLRELEDEAVRDEQRKKSARQDTFWRDFDDHNSPGGSGSGSSGSDGGGVGNGGGLSPAARFVC